MSKQELEKWKNKLELFFVLHGGPAYWVNHASPNFCDEFLCPLKGRCQDLFPPKPHILLCVQIENGKFKNFGCRKRGMVDYCAEWVRYV
jgi:hypothetical protein